MSEDYRIALAYMCYHSAKLWNQALFLLNKKEAKLNFYDLYNRLRSSVHLRALQSRASQIILDELVRAYKNHFKEPEKFAKPKPRRKHRTVIFDTTGFKVCGSRIRVSLSRSLRKHLKEKHGIDLRFLWLETGLPLNEKAIKNVQIAPKRDEFELHLIYEAEINPIDFSGSKVMTIDPGSSNFFAIVVEGVETPYIIDGKGLKSLLRKYLKRIKKLQSLKDNLKNKDLAFHKVERKIKKLWVKIHRLLRNFAHAVSNLVLELALRHNVKEIRVGDGFQNKNKESKLNSIADQMWHLLPRGKAFEYLKYKAEEAGIYVDTISEDYSSGADSLLNKAVAEESCTPELRVKRGLLKSVLGFINADVNACRSLLKKLGIFDKISGLGKPIRLRIFHKFKSSSAYEMGRSRGAFYQAVGIRLLQRQTPYKAPIKGQFTLFLMRTSQLFTWSKEIHVRFLYFRDCPNSEPAFRLLLDVLEEFKRKFKDKFMIEKIEIKSLEVAEKFRFLGSPTIQINGLDIEKERRNDKPFFGCRIYKNGKGVPPRDLIKNALNEALSPIP